MSLFSKVAIGLLAGLDLLAFSHGSSAAEPTDFNLMEATIADVHAAMRDGKLTARRLVEMYLARIVAYYKKGPALNAVIQVNSSALELADSLDAKFKASGPIGPLHGIPVLLKDNVNTASMPTTG